MQLFNRKRSIDNLTINSDNIELSDSTKFLGTLVDANMSWKSHLSYVSKKLSTCFYVLLQLKDVLNENALLNVYYALAYSALSYNIVVWGNAPYSERILLQQKKILRLIFKLHPRDSCRPIFKEKKILTFPSIYIYKTICYLKTNLNPEQNADSHEYNTRYGNHLRTEQHRTTLFKSNPAYASEYLYSVSVLTCHSGYLGYC